MNGEYDEFVIADSSTRPTGGTITLQHDGRGMFRTAATTEANHLLWHGTILMNAQVPNVGDGAYFYVSGDDCGIHHIQRIAKNLIVLGSNTSKPSGNERFTMLWRRR
jgi:hypothetical protein